MLVVWLDCGLLGLFGCFVGFRVACWVRVVSFLLLFVYVWFVVLIIVMLVLLAVGLFRCGWWFCGLGLGLVRVLYVFTFCIAWFHSVDYVVYVELFTVCLHCYLVVYWFYLLLLCAIRLDVGFGFPVSVLFGLWLRLCLVRGF